MGASTPISLTLISGSAVTWPSSLTPVPEGETSV